MRSVRIGRAIRWPGTCCRVAILLLSGSALLASGLPVLAQNTPVERPAIDRRFAPYVAEASKRFRIPEHWIRAVLTAESAHGIRAVSSAGAMGLMQVMPGTWHELRGRYSLGDDPFDPRDNILAGTAYLREMLDRYGSIGAMLAAYNAGPSRYDEHLATGRPLPPETRAYVAKLVPLLGGKPLPTGASKKPARRTDWRDAPLFVLPASGASAASSLQPGGQPDATAWAERADRDGATPARPERIFVTGSDEASSR
ncbi:lytic transglycosylase domain-containing protein [Mesorhizobium sp. M5C.F.Ca.IN.020.32.2.1]|uniref:lytic transglycosylase domain-containing protein n=1 Tax=Mesorhizobium sp. M5C.F.Ca.IN.020.32.2.1 TaxID=2496771 RepID=UPI000FD56512|nr:lytic transglycosylase domain-containing protein [Mesorhizobium sp. M5C.F.Ca.IN.020.32.2.1]RUV27579.1 lytic transglycosylase domain-containing protein [Mesorhizobium sp. M5C.F.Ca.IN.020.32.2.1]